MKIGRNDPCWCGSGRKYKQCHEAFDRKITSFEREGHIVPPHEIIKTPEQIAGIKESAKINIACLDEVAKQIRVGMSTQEIDDIVNRVTTEMGGIRQVSSGSSARMVPTPTIMPRNRCRCR